jgi:ribosomal protein RSM22 (predicted rRNA methylase)
MSRGDRFPTNAHARMKSLNSKNVNRFLKIKEALMVKLKMISVDHYFCPHQTQQNTVNIFQKIFYTETNGILVSLFFVG